MQLIDPTTGRVVWDSADPYAGPVPPAPEGRQWQVAGDMTPKAPTPQASGLDYYLGGTGLPNKLALLNQTFNPVEAMGQSMEAGRRMLSPGRSGWDRVADAGNMLSGVAGVVAPTYAAARGGMPAANALAETLTGISMTQQANALAGFAADESGALRLYHGSPHDFDRFSMDKIGTGEGAQAYGHGLYFAENEAVAQGYRDALAPGMGDGALRAIGISDGDLRTMRQFTQSSVDPDIALRDWLGWTGKRETPELRAAFMQEWSGRNPGRMYEVEINANPEDFLDWDKPLSEQPAKVREAMDLYGITPKQGMGYLATPKFDMRAEAMRRFGTDNFFELSAAQKSELNDASLSPSGIGVPDPKGEEIYQRLSDEIMSRRGTSGNLAEFAAENDATAKMREAGIPGIKYLDAGSRGAGDGSRNYVVFDENLITIVRKYGIAGAAAMLGVSVADVEQAMAQEPQ